MSRFPAKHRDDLRRDLLQDGELLGARLVDDELIDADLTVAPDNVL